MRKAEEAANDHHSAQTKASALLLRDARLSKEGTLGHLMTDWRAQQEKYMPEVPEEDLADPQDASISFEKLGLPSDFTEAR